MSKERLKQFKNNLDFLDDSADMSDYRRLIDTLENLYRDGELDWVYRYAREQAERVEELVRKQFNLMVELRKLDDRAFDDKEAIDQLKKENNRYKQALEDIKRILDLYPHVDYSKSVTRRRLFDLANEALEGEE